MKAVMIGLALFLVMGCGRSDAKKPSEELDARNKAWEAEAKGSMSSPAIGSGDTVYVGSWDKKLYAIKTDSKGPAKSPWPMRGQNARHTGRAPTK